MGFYILGLMIFILMIIFVNDLYKQYKEKNRYEDDVYYRYKTRYQHEFSDDFMSDDLEKQMLHEESNLNDSGVEPIWQNIEQMAFQQEIHRQSKTIHDEIPEERDEDKQRK